MSKDETAILKPDVESMIKRVRRTRNWFIAPAMTGSAFFAYLSYADKNAILSAMWVGIFILNVYNYVSLTSTLRNLTMLLDDINNKEKLDKVAVLYGRGT